MSLIKAIENGSTSEALAMISRGHGLQEKDDDQRTPLHYVCAYGHAEVAMALMERGADIDARDNIQSTPLHCACEKGHTKVAKALVERGADINATNRVSFPSPFSSFSSSLSHLSSFLFMRSST